MKILIVAATAQEINKDDFINHDVLITGIGMVNTVFSLTKYLHYHTPDLIINAGVAGAYNLDFKIGDVVEVSKDCFSEIGSQSGDDFLDVNGSKKLTGKLVKKDNKNGKSTLLNLMGYKKANMYAYKLKKKILRKLKKHGKKALELTNTIEFILGRNF